MVSFIISTLLCFAAAADLDPIKPDPDKSVKGYVEVNGRNLYVDYQAPQPGQPLIVNLNGLTYSTEQWANFNREMKSAYPGIGILSYDMELQGRTLAVIPNNKALLDEFSRIAKAYGEIAKIRTPMDHWRYFASGKMVSDIAELGRLGGRLWELVTVMGSTNAAIDTHYSEDTKDLKELIRLFAGNRPVHLVGLSYGGAIGLDFMSKHGHMVESAMILAPFMKSLPEQDAWIRVQMQIFRATYPWVMIEDGKLYDFFLRVLVYATYPSAEPVILENYLKTEGVYQKARASKDFNAYNKAHLYDRDGKIHVMLALQDAYVSKRSVEELVEVMPRESLASFTLIDGSGHKIIEEIPAYAAQIVRDIVKGLKKYTTGKTLLGDAKKNSPPRVISYKEMHKIRSVDTIVPGMEKNPLLGGFNPFMTPSAVACHMLFAK